MRLCPVCKILVSGQPIKCGCGYVEVPKIITLELYRGSEPLTKELEVNAEDLLLKVNSMLQELGLKTATMTSGYRTPEHNSLIGGAPNSKHCLAQAIDLADNSRQIGLMLYANLELLKKRGMAMEDLNYCVRKNGNKWCHLQSVPPGSGKTVFVPYPGPPRLT